MSEQLGHGGTEQAVINQPASIGSSGGALGFYGSAGTVKATLVQTTTRTTTQLRSELTALQNELVAKGLIAVS